jgi:hypothetical protein
VLIVPFPQDAGIISCHCSGNKWIFEDTTCHPERSEGSLADIW